MSLVISETGTPLTPPSALTKSRAIWTPAYSCLANGAWGPVSGKTAPTLMVAWLVPFVAVPHAESKKARATTIDSRTRTDAILGSGRLAGLKKRTSILVA